MQANRGHRLATLDLETDPFKVGRAVKPFAAGFYCEEFYQEFWGDDCAERVAEYICDLPHKYMIFAHNGGKFDFFLLLERGLIAGPLKIINYRITRCHLGRHQLRDSFSILPVPLAEFRKSKIDYKLMERPVRNHHKSKILKYLKDDCRDLFEFVAEFITDHGCHLTIGSAAIRELREFHPFEYQRASHDEKFRPYFHGGRCEAFQTGIHHGDFHVYDVNSMYPYVMSSYQHPTGSEYVETTWQWAVEHPEWPAFVHFTAWNNGAFLTRTPDGLDFNMEHGEFFLPAWELHAALRHGLCAIEKIHTVNRPLETISFGEYVAHYSKRKRLAKAQKDKAREIFAKLFLNSAYGKFAQNPCNFYVWELFQEGDDELYDGWPVAPWEMALSRPPYVIARKPATARQYFDVATAASITGAARAILLDALHRSKGVLYCDTDSIICESMPCRKHPTRLGYWKDETPQGVTRAAIAGKKTYAVWNGRKVVKTASKGVQITARDVLDICNGKTVLWEKDAPTFSLLHPEQRFLSRKIAMKKPVKAG